MVFKYKDRDVAVIAHRGGGLLFPENTISAFKGVQKLGVDAVECDVQLTMDGKLAVMHDPNLKRMAGIDKRISEVTSDDIKKIILLNNEKIPMLDELIKDVDTRLIIELKSIETINPIFKIIYEQQESKDETFLSPYFIRQETKRNQMRNHVCLVPQIPREELLLERNQLLLQIPL